MQRLQNPGSIIAGTSHSDLGLAQQKWLPEMASPSPVPSRAAIHALRGVALTTSCSVILLAEERRRRINVARAAIDNAKKLHTIRSNHSLALGEGLTKREAWSEEALGEKCLAADSAAPKPRVHSRRKRRDARDEESSRRPEAPNQTVSHAATETTNSKDAIHQSSKRLQEVWADWNSMRREVSRIPGAGSSSYHDIHYRVAADSEMPNFGIEKLAKLQAEASAITNPKRSTAVPPEITACHQQSPGISAVRPPEPDDCIGTNEESREVQFLSPETHLRQRSEEFGRISLNLSSADEPTTVSTTEANLQVDVVDSPEALDPVDLLLSDLARDEQSRRKQRDALYSTVVLFPKLVSSTSLESDDVAARALTLLEVSCSLKQWEHIVPIIESAMPACDDVMHQILEPFIDLVQRLDARKAFRELLYHYEKFQLAWEKHVSNNVNRSWITELLNRRWHRTKNFRQVQSMYNLFRMSGLLTHRSISQATKHGIRRRYIMLALSNGLIELAAKEAQQSQLYMPLQTRIDMEMRAHFITQKAKKGQWDKVESDIDRFTRKQGASGKYYQKLLADLTAVYAQDHHPEEVDNFVRDMVGQKHMDLNQSLALLMAERHGQNQDMEALIQWLKFCHEQGLEMDQAFLSKVANNCREHWNFNAQDLRDFAASLATLVPWVNQPQVHKYTVDGGLVSVIDGQAAHVYETVAKPHPFSELATFRSMNAEALEMNWEQMLQTYFTAQSRGMSYSPRCLRLAVIARIKQDNGATENAADLVAAARAEGHDVSSALVPLLLARLDAGASVDVLVRGILRDGAHIHDSVYNKAARHLMDIGNLDGVVTICEVAARENGKGDLLYNKYAFSNLIYAYTCQGRYEMLKQLLSAFMSATVSWHGSKECKEIIKLSIKKVNSRAHENPAERWRHDEVRLFLQSALEHVRAVRASHKETRQAFSQGIQDIFRNAETQDTADDTTLHNTRQDPGISREAKAAPLRAFEVDIKRKPQTTEGLQDEVSVEHSYNGCDKKEFVMPARSARSFAGKAF